MGNPVWWFMRNLRRNQPTISEFAPLNKIFASNPGYNTVNVSHFVSPMFLGLSLRGYYPIIQGAFRLVVPLRHAGTMAGHSINKTPFPQGISYPRDLTRPTTLIYLCTIINNSGCVMSDKRIRNEDGSNSTILRFPSVFRFFCLLKACQ